MRFNVYLKKAILWSLILVLFTTVCTKNEANSKTDEMPDKEQANIPESISEDGLFSVSSGDDEIDSLVKEKVIDGSFYSSNVEAVDVKYIYKDGIFEKTEETRKKFVE
ncbi:hypothetical protein SAMN02910298_01253 [Pseudobutyrivibrio sp. YE44]|uniref:hypothetical protein n=1 Tax=Pseudobutyrivibrio sp. YE44 TaxID=1520802 RepID=UPI00087F9D3D|nr:hypothetical protein [Pseudobutyrivibrio sp. YE44]SDB25022.1 hypothetical protein SAMN02910298_01253 [Pseudobutyrivibrio sp. YE44]